jgi:MFS family permease
VPESRADRPRRIDPVGQVLVIAGLATLTYGIIDAPSAGWLSFKSVALFVVSIASFISLVVYELHRREPLLEVRFFRSAPFSGAIAIAVAMFAVMGGFLFLGALYLQDVRHLSALDAGLLLLPMAGMMMVIAPISGRIVGSRGTRVPLLCGSFGVTASGLILTQLSDTTPYPVLIGAFVLLGLGMGLINPPITNTAVSGMPPSQAGVAAAVASTGRQVGQTLGVAVLGALAGTAAAGAIGPGFAQATHVAWWIVVVLGVVIFVLGLVSTTQWALATATRTAERFSDEQLASPDGARSPDDRSTLVAG